jgi:chemotaxis protein CheD
MAEIHVLKGSGQFSCLGLGSCIGLAAYDPSTKVAAMIHVMLPKAFDNTKPDKLGKFADTGVPEMIRMMKSAGANTSRLQVALAGGAQVFKFGSEKPRLDIGDRNTEAVKEQVKAFGMKVIAEDTGGNLGRTVIYTVESGEIRVRTVSQGECVLCTLR